ncbi:MAG: acetyl-CoA carboxylase biotin carboxylase subunit [Chloroflexota bacterium]
MPGQNMFTKILIANRGEIAVRIIRACKELGIATVGIYSSTDETALHVRLADEAVFLGPPTPQESYLAANKIIQAAKVTGAQAIHPGYGFLAENAAFAEAVTEAGIVFIGPSASAIKAMGDKAAARTLMEKANVPLVPGYQGKDDDKNLAKAAKEIGYPVLIKAAAGGGGKGMRVVEKASGLAEGVAAARREAQHAFGDERLIMEKYIANGRHIEFQILADQHGSILHLFERECSVQRRYQKIIEETPSPFMNDSLRLKMSAAALAAAKAVDYASAGTVEFIVAEDTRSYYFLEMNTRLQVEHPITELTTGIDLVQWQIKVAAGEKLPFAQEDITQRGHSIEARLYAEDPGNMFLPAVGHIKRWEPAQGLGVRVDSGIESGSEITVHYDPLMAKIIVLAEDREIALRKMRQALQETVVLGLATNKQFLTDLIDHQTFQDSAANISFVEDHFNNWQQNPEGTPVLAAIAAALSEMHTQSSTNNHSQSETDPYSPWRKSDSFRIGGSK